MQRYFWTNNHYLNYGYKDDKSEVAAALNMSECEDIEAKGGAGGEITITFEDGTKVASRETKETEPPPPNTRLRLPFCNRNLRSLVFL